MRISDWSSDVCSSDLGRGLAIGMFYVSANLGAVVAAAAGGYLAEHHGWRTALFVAGAPGIFAALLLFFTVDEPRRGEMEEAEADGSTAPLAKARFVDVLRFIWHKPALTSEERREGEEGVGTFRPRG